MSTGSVQSASKTLSRHKELNNIFLTMTNDAGEALVAGQEVFINGDFSVDKRVDGSELPIGMVDVGGGDGELITVHANLLRTVRGIIKGGAATANQLLIPNGTVTGGLPEYVAATPSEVSDGTLTGVLGDIAQAVALEGALQDAELQIGILRNPVQIIGAVAS